MVTFISLQPQVAKLFVRLVLCSGLSVVSTPVSSQTVLSDVLHDWQELRRKTGAQEFLDPRTAIRTYQEFYEQEGYRDTRTSLEITQLIAQLYWQELKDPQKALTIYDWGIKQFGHGRSGRLLRQSRKVIIQNSEFRQTFSLSPTTGDEGDNKAAKVLSPVEIEEDDSATEIAPVTLFAEGGNGLANVEIPADEAPASSKVLLKTGPEEQSDKQKATASRALFPVELPQSTKSGMPPIATVPGAPDSPVKVLLPVEAQPAQSSLNTVAEVDPRRIALTNGAWALRQKKMSVADFMVQLHPTVTEAQWLLNMPTAASTWNEDRSLHIALIDLINTENPKALQTLEKLSLPMQLALAEYYISRRNTESERVFQLLLTKKFPGDAGFSKLSALNSLAEYYGEMGQYIKAADAKLALQSQTTSEVWISNTNVEAARYYIQAGKPEKALELYRKSEKSSYGWAVGLALYDQGVLLISQGRYDEAIKVLSQPVEGRYADQIKVALLANLGYSYYRVGKANLAKEISNKAIQQYNALQNPLRGEGLRAQVNGAKQTLRWIGQWEKEPVLIKPQHVTFNINRSNDPADTLNLTQILQVLTEKDVSLDVISTDPSISTEIRNIPAPNDGGYIYYAQKEVIIKLDRSKINRSKEVMLEISLSGPPQSKVTVPMQITVPDAIELSDRNAFFGFVKTGETADNDITLTANKPFHILEVSSGIPELQVKFDAKQDSKKHVLHLQLMATESSKIYKGEIHVTTDLPEQRELSIAYYGYAQE